MLAVIAATSGIAFADDRVTCNERDGERSIEACSRIVAAEQLAGKDLATIYVLRASMYRTNQQYSLAIDDLSKAIDLLKPLDTKSIVASAFNTRANIYVLAGDVPKALDDYRQSVALDSSNAQAAEGLRQLQAQLADTRAAPPDTAAQADAIAAPNERLPDEISVPPGVLQLVQTHPFFANAPPVRAGGYSYDQLVAYKINGFRGVTSITNDVSVRWLKQGIAYEQTIMESEVRSTATSKLRTKMSSMEAANGLVGLGYQSFGISYIPGIKPRNINNTSTIERLEKLQGTIFPIRVGNRFSYEATFQDTWNYQPPDERTFFELCQITQRYDAYTFHPDLAGSAYLESCQDQTSFRRNKAADTIIESRTLYFDQLGIPIRVDPQSPPQKLIQTYFKNESTESARLQSFSTAR